MPTGRTLIGDVRGDPLAPAILLLHGGGQTRHAWSRAACVLADQGYHTLAYDMRGHGESDWSPTGDYSLPALADDLAAIRATIDGPVVVVGASLGGITGFYAMATRGPAFAQALVMVDIVLRSDRVGTERIRRFMAGHPEGFATLEDAEQAVAAYNPDHGRPRAAGGLARNLRQGEDGRWRWHWDPRLLDAVGDLNARADLLVGVSPGVTRPVLLVRGGGSDVVRPAGIDEMRGAVPQLEVAEVPGVGHIVASDGNDAFVKAMTGFLHRHLPPVAERAA